MDVTYRMVRLGGDAICAGLHGKPNCGLLAKMTHGSSIAAGKVAIEGRGGGRRPILYKCMPLNTNILVERLPQKLEWFR